MRTRRIWPTCPQRWIMETVLYVICSILMVMNFRHPLQAKFEGYLIILFLPPPPWVLESHRWIPNIDVGFSLLVVLHSCHCHAPSSCNWALHTRKVIAKSFSSARRTSHPWSPLRDGSSMKSQIRRLEGMSSCYQKEVTFLEVTFWWPLKWLGCQLESNYCSTKYSWY